MKQEELQSIVSGLVDELRELPDHTELTTWQLMDRAGYMDEELPLLYCGAFAGIIDPR